MMGMIGDLLASLKEPARRTGCIKVGTMASGMEITLPYVVIRGAHPGKTLWLHGQVHGDEINGMVAALNFARSLSENDLHGNVVVTPTGNPHALDARRKRNPYDDLDLDQQYPGNSNGLVSDRLAAALFAEIKGVADLVINLHTMNPLFDSKAYAVYKVHPQSGIGEIELLRAISLFAPNVACRMDIDSKAELPGNIAGALDYQCLAAGIPSFMIELGGGSRYEPDNVAFAERGFRSLARYLGILPEPALAKPAAIRRVTRRGWMTAVHGGLFVPALIGGQDASAGEMIGQTMNLLGEMVEEPRLQQDSVIIGLRRDPVVHTGDRLAFVALEWDRVDM